LFAAKDEIYCLFKGVLTNLGSLRQQYGLSKSADEVVLVIEAYKALHGCLAFADDLDLLKGSCGKSLAPFPKGCYYSNALGGLKSYENPKHKVEGSAVLAATH
ncbi:hypothetical protein B296_00045075, partial [Ensete ventricosum]